LESHLKHAAQSRLRLAQTRGIFVACVLTFRRGMAGELAHWLRIKL
jgi:hypothetical protein